jgi:arabinogalactan oligomer / maltooligosaccharide transport system substrate-binding protein
MRDLARIVTMVFAGWLVAGCGGGTKPAGDAAATSAEIGPADLVIWHGYRAEEKAAFEKVVAEYNAARAAQGVKATTLAVPYDAFADKITAAVPRGKGPDIFIFAQDRLGGWIEAGNTIEPIDFYVDAGVRDRFLPTAVEAMTYQGTLYGLPLNYKVITMIYNKKLVAQPPKTSGELVQITKANTDPAAGRYGLVYAYSDFYYHAALMNGFGGGVFGPDREPTIASTPNVASIELMMRWFDVDKIMPAEPSVALITSMFNQGKAAITFSGPWFLGEIASDIDYGLAPLPTLDEANGQPIRPWMTVEGVYVTAPSQQKEAAYDFLAYVTDTAAGRVMAVEGRQTPANLAVYNDPQVAADPVLSVFREQVDVAVPMPNLAEMTMAWSPLTTAMNTITKKAATPRAAMETAQREVEERIASLRSGK